MPVFTNTITLFSTLIVYMQQSEYIGISLTIHLEGLTPDFFSLFLFYPDAGKSPTNSYENFLELRAYSFILK